MTSGQLERLLRRLPRDLNVRISVHGIPVTQVKCEVQKDGMGRFALDLMVLSWAVLVSGMTLTASGVL